MMNGWNVLLTASCIAVSLVAAVGTASAQNTFSQAQQGGGGRDGSGNLHRGNEWKIRATSA